MNVGDCLKIKWIKFKNCDTDLEIDKISFFDDITLLVGLSGVGKTQILRAISYIFELATRRTALYACKASIAVEIHSSIYEWDFTITKDTDNNNSIPYLTDYRFSQEKLSRDKTTIFERNESFVYLMNYSSVPTPKRDESLALQYAEDKNVKEFIEGMRCIYPIEVDMAIHGALSCENFKQLISQVNTIYKNQSRLNERILYGLPVILKLHVIKRYFPEIYLRVFDMIKELFIEIQDIDVVEDNINEIYLIAIKVYDKWITQKDISNGMLKSIHCIVELQTMSPNTLVLFDEFENGLGVNCIDVLADMLLNTRNDLQFIITSHHPKIINTIPSSKWRIIDRDRNIIKNSDSTDYGIGNSQHEPYFNLINRWEYEGKV